MRNHTNSGQAMPAPAPAATFPTEAHRLLHQQEAADWLAISDEQFRKLEAAGHVRPVQLGKSAKGKRYMIEDLLRCARMLRDGEIAWEEFDDG